MKMALIACISIFLSNLAQAQVLDVPSDARQLPDIVLAAPADLVQAEKNYDNAVEKNVAELADLQRRIQVHNDRLAQIKKEIPDLKKVRREHNKKDRCWGTLDKKYSEYNCSAPFSGDTDELKGHYLKAREADDQIEGLRKERSDIRDDLRKLTAQADKIESERAALARKQAKEDERLRREEEKRQKQLADLQRKSELNDEKGRQSMIAAEERVEKAKTAQETRAKAASARNERALAAKIRRADVKTAFTELKLEEAEMKMAIQMIEEQYDRSLMGIYMQKKMAALLESDVLCKKVAECSAGKKSAVTQDEMSKIFPSAPQLPAGSTSSGTR